MDLSAKTLAQTVSFFFGIFLLLSVLSFYMVAAQARSAAYSIVEYLEIREYDQTAQSTIDEYADSYNLDVSVSPINDGMYPAGDHTRYKVEVTFHHIFSVLNFGRDTTYTLYTRAVDY